MDFNRNKAFPEHRAFGFLAQCDLPKIFFNVEKDLFFQGFLRMKLFEVQRVTSFIIVLARGTDESFLKSCGNDLRYF